MRLAFKKRPGNYCEHAIEFLRSAVATGALTAHRNVELSMSICFGMATAERFMAPEWGIIFDREGDFNREAMREYLYLPFDGIAIEFEAPESENLAPGNLACPKRIVYAVPVGDRKFGTLVHTGADYPQEIPLSSNDFVMFSIYEAMSGLWDLGPLALVIRPDEPWINSISPSMDMKCRVPQFSAHWVCSAETVNAQGWPKDPMKDLSAVDKIVSDFTDEFFALIDTCIAMNMPPPTDGELFETIPAPERLNKKRLKKNKVPFTEYKVVDCYAKPQHLPKKLRDHLQRNDERGIMRKHSVKRHTRTLPNGKSTWVRAHWRGNPAHGVINKTHRMQDRRTDK